MLDHDKRKLAALRAVYKLSGGAGYAKLHSSSLVQDVSLAARLDPLEGACPPRHSAKLACGPGTFTGELADRAASVTGLDASPGMLEIAAARIVPRTNVQFACADLFAWTPDRRYDFVFFRFWLSHVPAEWFASFWSAVASGLAPGGRAMFVDDGHRTSEELVEGPGSSTIERKTRFDANAQSAIPTRRGTCAWV